MSGHRRGMRIAAFLPIGLCAALHGCAGGAGHDRPDRPALINHPVFFRLSDPADAGELIRDCDEWIASIPSVESYYCGTPFDTGRDTVDADYHVGLYVGFASEAGYDAYVEHPNHVMLVEKWRPRLRGILIRDVIDGTP